MSASAARRHSSLSIRIKPIDSLASARARPRRPLHGGGEIDAGASGGQSGDLEGDLGRKFLLVNPSDLGVRVAQIAEIVYHDPASSRLRTAFVRKPESQEERISVLQRF